MIKGTETAEHWPAAVLASVLAAFWLVGCCAGQYAAWRVPGD